LEERERKKSHSHSHHYTSSSSPPSTSSFKGGDSFSSSLYHHSTVDPHSLAPAASSIAHHGSFTPSSSAYSSYSYPHDHPLRSATKEGTKKETSLFDETLTPTIIRSAMDDSKYLLSTEKGSESASFQRYTPVSHRRYVSKLSSSSANYTSSTSSSSLLAKNDNDTYSKRFSSTDGAVDYRK
jgi:hypothetical protein